MRMPRVDDHIVWIQQDDYGTLYMRTGTVSHRPYRVDLPNNFRGKFVPVSTGSLSELHIDLDDVVAVSKPRRKKA